ncbi:TonB family protein [Pedobacter sp. HMF7647]|uniref:TonB family protein n=1 Tax=Hufsiella arboris TaxID=2695275 RepID=A0A7K1Y5R5_9SPHI|nr:TonB family protein [Hufsiella arboris]MXV49927.1 TonB family protein [Hufsiella arboris]
MLYWIFSIISIIFNQPGNPEFKGGNDRLNTFIGNSIVYPEFSKQNCIQGTVQVSFLLDHQGKIVSSKINKGFGLDLDAEALRVVRLTSGKWIVPASYDTTYSVILPINFALQDYQCNTRSKDDINKAIENYRSRQDLSKAVVNFYRNKEKGTDNAADEMTILDLKAQLGYDDRYIDQKLREAQTKLKQGDKESACEDFNFIHYIGSDKADKLRSQYCN